MSAGMFLCPRSLRNAFSASRKPAAAQQHGHGDIAVVCDSATHTSDHRVRRFDHIGGGQAARQLSGHTKSVDCEQLLQSFKQAGSGIRMLRLQMLGMRFEFLDAGIGVPFERLSHYPAGLGRPWPWAGARQHCVSCESGSAARGQRPRTSDQWQSAALSTHREFGVWLPPVTKQNELASKLDALHKETQRLESICQRKPAALDALKKSLLHQAFSGAL